MSQSLASVLRLRIIVTVLLGLCAAGVLFFLVANTRVLVSARGRVASDAESAPHSQAAIIFGAAVYSGTPSPILEDRLQAAVDLYKAGRVDKLLISGDHGQHDYDEVNPMRRFVLNAGVPAEDVFMDHAGFRTYDTIARAKKVFRVESAILVTQRFHLPRALFIARRIGLRATGLAADRRLYLDRRYLAARESLARVKDFVNLWFRSEPRYLGPEIPITGDGRLTIDRASSDYAPGTL